MMDIIIHWGVLRHIRKDVGANPVVLVSAILLDTAALGAFIMLKAQSDPLIIIIASVGMLAVFGFERFYLSHRRDSPVESTGHLH